MESFGSRSSFGTLEIEVFQRFPQSDGTPTGYPNKLYLFGVPPLGRHQTKKEDFFILSGGYLGIKICCLDNANERGTSGSATEFPVLLRSTVAHLSASAMARCPTYFGSSVALPKATAFKVPSELRKPKVFKGILIDGT